jgi:hypothetical protein
LINNLNKKFEKMGFSTKDGDVEAPLAWHAYQTIHGDHDTLLSMPETPGTPVTPSTPAIFFPKLPKEFDKR